MQQVRSIAAKVARQLSRKRVTTTNNRIWHPAARVGETNNSRKYRNASATVWDGRGQRTTTIIFIKKQQHSTTSIAYAYLKHDIRYKKCSLCAIDTFHQIQQVSTCCIWWIVLNMHKLYVCQSDGLFQIGMGPFDSWKLCSWRVVLSRLGCVVEWPSWFSWDFLLS